MLHGYLIKHYVIKAANLSLFWAIKFLKNLDIEPLQILSLTAEVGILENDHPKILFEDTLFNILTPQCTNAIQRHRQHQGYFFK